MLPEQTLQWGRSRSCIRELMEYGAVRKSVIGTDKVFDFSIGNPSVPAPAGVNEAIAELIRGDSVALHSYTTAAGLMSLRTAIAREQSQRLRVSIDPAKMYITCGAAAGLAIALRALLLPGDEVMAMAPFFPEYRVFTEASGGVLVTVPPRESDFQIDLDAFAAALSDKTRCVILNSPNNPSGVVLSEETLTAVGELLRAHEEKTGRTIYLISDEPYRELVYDGIRVPCPLDYYEDAILCYSYSKSMSIPGERIGYLALSGAMREAEDVYASILGAGRALGYVNPPSLFQRVVERCLGQTADISVYKENRDKLLGMLRNLGYTCIEPQGAFYLFVKALEPDAKAFSEAAKRHELLLVPSDDFGCPGYVRVAYCVDGAMIERSEPAFRALAREYGL